MTEIEKMANACNFKMGALVFTEGNDIQMIFKMCSGIKKNEIYDDKYTKRLEKIASMFIIKGVDCETGLFQQMNPELEGQGQNQVLEGQEPNPVLDNTGNAPDNTILTKESTASVNKNLTPVSSPKQTDKSVIDNMPVIPKTETEIQNEKVNSAIEEGLYSDTQQMNLWTNLLTNTPDDKYMHLRAAISCINSKIIQDIKKIRLPTESSNDLKHLQMIFLEDVTKIIESCDKCGEKVTTAIKKEVSDTTASTEITKTVSEITKTVSEIKTKRDNKIFKDIFDLLTVIKNKEETLIIQISELIRKLTQPEVTSLLGGTRRRNCRIKNTQTKSKR